MAVTLLRHTTPEIAKGVCYGITDLALADSFPDEAQGVLDSLPACTSIMSSPLHRCRRLAETIATKRNLEVQIDPSWREMDFGRWEGIPWNEIPRGELDGWAADFDGYDAHGGESVAGLRDRVSRALAATRPDTLVVTHMGCIKAALALRNHPDGWNAQLAFGTWTQI